MRTFGNDNYELKRILIQLSILYSIYFELQKVSKLFRKRILFISNNIDNWPEYLAEYTQVNRKFDIEVFGVI